MIWDFKSRRGQHEYCSHLSWLKLTTKTNQAKEVVTPFHSGVLKSLISQSSSWCLWTSVQDAGAKLHSYKSVIGPKLVDNDWFKVGKDVVFTFRGYCSRNDCRLMCKPLVPRSRGTVFFCTNWACVKLEWLQGPTHLLGLHMFWNRTHPIKLNWVPPGPDQSGCKEGLSPKVTSLPERIHYWGPDVRRILYVDS